MNSLQLSFWSSRYAWVALFASGEVPEFGMVAHHHDYAKVDRGPTVGKVPQSQDFTHCHMGQAEVWVADDSGTLEFLDRASHAREHLEDRGGF